MKARVVLALGAMLAAGGQVAAAQEASPPAPVPYADQVFGKAAMDRARAVVRQEHGGETYSQITLNFAEGQPFGHDGGYRWHAEAWAGGDIHRLVAKTGGEGDAGRLGSAEAQLLYSRAVTPYFDLQAGVRQDFAVRPRTYAALGFEGLAPGLFEIGGAVFLSDRGDLRARAEGSHDFLLTQRLVLQPRLEVNLAAASSARDQVGGGLSDAQFGLRLRYEISRRFTPYVGLAIDRKFGDTADYARARGQSRSQAGVVMGLRAYF